MIQTEPVCELPQRCLHSFQALQDNSLEPESGIDIWYPQDSGKNHFHQLSLWSIMSDRPSYTIHPQASGVIGSGCMDFCIDRLNHQTLSQELEVPSNFEGIEALDYLSHQSDTIAELNINRSYDDLLDVSTTYLGTDLVQMTDVFNAQPSFPITLDCHTNGELLGGGKLDIFGHRSIKKLYVQSILYASPPFTSFPQISICY